MNIHFTNRVLFNTLNVQTISKIKVGSHMYGLNNSDSDTDFLSIYTEPNINRASFMWEHHQLQYKENNIDYNFTNLQSFIRNAMTGDATINFEVLFSDELKNSELYWLYEFRYDFINYNIIKSYLGLAKRDLKYWKRDTTDNKKLSHFIRGIIFANTLINGEFSMDLSKTKTFSLTDYNDLELLDRIKHGTLDYSFEILTTYFEDLMNDLRLINNNNLRDKKIPLYMDTKRMSLLDSKVLDFTKEKADKILELNYSELYYEALENGVSY